MKPHVDTETLQARFHGKQELLKKIYHQFSLHVDAVLPEMRTAYEASDLNSLTEMAHTLKGNAALIGASRVSELAFDVQKASSVGDVQLLTSSLPQLFEEVQVVLDELKHFVSDPNE
ncbi:MAG: Hpt domain-containing protein [Desulfovermiculus sp.]|nr:Hpt domain-containing protein [Desulfovermiculus sp.]